MGLALFPPFPFTLLSFYSPEKQSSDTIDLGTYALGSDETKVVTAEVGTTYRNIV